jgi:uncharacterized protein
VTETVSGSVRVLQIWRYPVKSLGGERLPAARLEPGGGVPGDRQWAVRDVMTGQIATAKRDERLLFAWAETGAGGGVGIGVPGIVDLVPAECASDTLSAWLGRRVETCRRSGDPSGASFDFGFPVEAGAHSYGDCGDVLHLVSRSTLRHLRTFVPGYMSASEAVRRTRPNLVVDAGGEPFAENAWVGRTINLGTARLSVVGATTRCVMVDRAQPGVPTRELLAGLVERHSGTLGVYATVERPGEVVADPAGDGDV